MQTINAEQPEPTNALTLVETNSTKNAPMSTIDAIQKKR